MRSQAGFAFNPGWLELPCPRHGGQLRPVSLWFFHILVSDRSFSVMFKALLALGRCAAGLNYR